MTDLCRVQDAEDFVDSLLDLLNSEQALSILVSIICLRLPGSAGVFQSRGLMVHFEVIHSGLLLQVNMQDLYGSTCIEGMLLS